MSRVIDIASFKSLSQDEIATITDLTISDSAKYTKVNILNISAFTNLSNLTLRAKSRMLVKGLLRCFKLKSLITNNAIFDIFANESLESLNVNNWYGEEVDPTGFPNLTSINIDSSKNINVNKVSQLKYLRNCTINCNAYGKIKSNSIVKLYDNGSNVIYYLPRLISYVGHFNESIFTNSNVKSIGIGEGDFNINATINLPNLVKLSTSSNYIELYNLIAKTCKLYKLSLHIYDSKNLINCEIHPSLKVLDISGQPTEISNIINKFPSVENLSINFHTGHSEVKQSMNCPLKKLSMDSCKFPADLLRYFNLSNLSSLRCNVNNFIDPFDIPTLIELYCNEFILTKNNATNLKIYHGPITSDINLINVEEIYDPNNTIINVESMSKLKTVNGISVEEYIIARTSVMAMKNCDKSPIMDSRKNSIDFNIEILLTKHICWDKTQQYINSNMNHIYFYVKNDTVKSNTKHDCITIKLIVDAIIAKLIQLQDENEKHIIVNKINDVFTNCRLDDSDVIIKALFTTLDGKLGITMDINKHILRQKLTDLQKRIDDLRNIILNLHC